MENLYLKHHKVKELLYNPCNTLALPSHLGEFTITQLL